MALSSEVDDGNDAVSSDPLTEETTTTKRKRLNSSAGTLTSPSPSSSDTFEDSVHATELPTLPFEIMIEILSRLPVKFLMQLQSVCKSWKFLISDPKFAKKHLRVSTSRHHLLLTFPCRSSEIFISAYLLSSVFTEVTATTTQLEFPLNNGKCFPLIVGSCHGILCFSLDQRFILLWNPSIRKFMKFPDSPKRKGSYTIYGFGYTRLSDRYKVVAVLNYCESDGSYKTQVNVLTLGTSAWRRIQDLPSGVQFYDLGKFLSGTVNWLTSRHSSSSPVISLDLEKESYQEFLQPDYGGVTMVTISLGVLRDCLCIFSFTDTFSDVWLMQEYGNKDSWTKLIHFPKMGCVGSCLSTKALYVSEDDKVLLSYRSGLVVYNARDGTFKTLEVQDNNEWVIPEIYQESLISPLSRPTKINRVAIDIYLFLKNG